MSAAIVKFVQGIPGFEHLHEFVFQSVEGEHLIKIMASAEEPDVSFPVVSPFAIYPDYEWTLPDSAQEELKIAGKHEVEIWSIVTIPADQSHATVNLLAPLVVNPVKLLGKQLILHDSSYSSRAPLFAASGDQPNPR